jgi:predicted nucleic acid-binding Zn ribbon protein
MSENALSKKPNCDTKNCNVTRLISGGAGLIFKGSGFYLTDYKTKDKPKDKAKSETSSSKKSEPKTQKKEP